MTQAAGLPGYLALDRRLLPVGPAPLREWKAILDLALARLGCPPAERSLLSEVQRQLSAAAPEGQRGGGRLRYENRRVLVYADRRGPLWIFEKSAAVLRETATVLPVKSPDGDRVRIVWNGREREYPLAAGESCGEWRPGLKARAKDGRRLAVNQLLREAGVPEPVRARLPVILAADGTARTLCLGFWEQLRDRHFTRI